MTGSHAGGTTGRRTGSGRRSLGWRIGTPVVALLSGSLLAVSATNSEGTDLRPGRYTDLAGLVEGEAANYRTVEDRFNKLSDEVERLSAGVKDKSVDEARGEIAQLRDPAGMTPHAGPGLRITLSDAPEDLVDDAVERNKQAEPDKRVNLNRFVVHQQDIQALVNALWNGGASAVTIAGQRVISTTGIKCEGNAVQLQGVPYPQPYVIEAVGDPSELYSSVATDHIVAGYRTDSENPEIGIGWSLDFKERVEAPAYDGVVDLHYAKPLR
ncbi:DUF881 domain-containing protein [Pimelobacter simplex]|uniref:DUF881 domain-containing protein n=1 Tax=Nocardioides simplex TaxID=2045 RepID=UPI00214FD871|nr:DUF881 domain-containing protein [Pimelobacter simplex]UUW90894.1 DUF881 domain-containing protein [Pimelobacter simplex]UUW94723.1 DUF881 domain-containing protein [Pimelobacter simplex]